MKGAPDAGAVESSFFAAIQATPNLVSAIEGQTTPVNISVGKLYSPSHPSIVVNWTTQDGSAKAGNFFKL